MTTVDADMNRTLLAVAYPEFRFSYGLREHVRPGERATLRWIAVRRDIRAPGVHTVVTTDLEELLVLLGPSCWWTWRALDRVITESLSKVI